MAHPLPHSPAQDGHIWALKDVSFSVQQGEVPGIIGRNGAVGKEHGARGTEHRASDPQFRNRKSEMSLNPPSSFIPHPSNLTGRENIYLNGAILGMSRREIQQKFDEIVAFAEIEKFIDTPVDRGRTPCQPYSSGMYVRLAFAVFHPSPRIGRGARTRRVRGVRDEVLAVGDAAFQKKRLGKMGEVAKLDQTVVLPKWHCHSGSGVV